MKPQMFDVDAQLDAAFGKEGTPERKAAEDRANANIVQPINFLPLTAY